MSELFVHSLMSGLNISRLIPNTLYHFLYFFFVDFILVWFCGYFTCTIIQEKQGFPWSATVHNILKV